MQESALCAANTQKEDRASGRIPKHGLFHAIWQPQGEPDRLVWRLLCTSGKLVHKLSYKRLLIFKMGGIPMSEQKAMAQCCDPRDLKQCMSIHTRKITDSCRDKDCIEDLRVYLITSSQSVLDTAANARVRCAELITTYIDVEPVAFDRNRYCIDLTFYYRVLADAVVGNSRPATLHGLAVFSKRAVLCGEDSRAHIYRSDTRLGAYDGPSLLTANLPTAVVEVTAHNSQGEILTYIQIIAAVTKTAAILTHPLLISIF